MQTVNSFVIIFTKTKGNLNPYTSKQGLKSHSLNNSLESIFSIELKLWLGFLLVLLMACLATTQELIQEDLLKLTLITAFPLMLQLVYTYF